MFDDDSGTVFRDVITLTLAGFMAAVVLMLPWVNPPGEKQQSEIAAVGDLVFETTWPDDMDADVDQWIQAIDETPVGYSNKGGVSCNLLRDDLGRFVDPLKTNHEITICRGLRDDGEYTFNIHLFRAPADRAPVQVNTAVSIRNPSGGIDKKLHQNLVLERAGQEMTVVRFRFDGEGIIDPGSVVSLHKPLVYRGGIR